MLQFCKGIDVCDFYRNSSPKNSFLKTDLVKFWSSAVGAVRLSVQIADKNRFHKTLIDGLEWCGLLWCFYQLFGLSFWRHPFTSDEPLGEQVMYCNFSKFVQMKKQAHLHLGWPESEYIVSKLHFLQKLRLRSLFLQPHAVPKLYAIYFFHKCKYKQKTYIFLFPYKKN